MTEIPGSQPSQAGENGSAVPASECSLNNVAMERLLSRVAAGADPGEGRAGCEYLLFICGSVQCAAPLTDLREVLLARPPAVPLPFSPAWLLGLFPLRTDLLGLVDPAPFLLAATASSGSRSLGVTLIAEHDGVPLGLAVDAVGDIKLVSPDELAPVAVVETCAVVAPYAAAVYSSAQGDAQGIVVDLPRLVEDLLAALRRDASGE